MKSILLIEDDPFLIDIYTTKLKEMGFQADVATDGKKGLEKLKKNTPDLLLLDIVLPKIDGWQVLEEIEKLKKEKGPSGKNKLKDLKVLVLSNLSQKEEVEKGLRLGATKYLIKASYTPSEIIEEIKKLL